MQACSIDVWAAVERHMGGPFAWGAADCCAAPCAVFAELWGIDPMAGLRDRYGRATEARATLRRAGGLARLARRLAAEAGLRRVDPRGAPPGAIGLIRHAGGVSLAIRLGPQRVGAWAGKSRDGIVLVADARLAWGP